MMFSDGFKIIEGVLAEAECDELIEELCGEDPIKGRAGVRNLMSNPYVLRLASDERLIAITEHLFGRPLIPYKATLFRKTGKANWLVAWHQDTALPLEGVPDDEGWGPVSVKDAVTFVHAPTWALSKILALRIHLDPSTERNGPLRVIPGSHRERLLDDEEFDEWAERVGVECHVGKGGVIAMSPLILHASSKCREREERRVLHIEYTADLVLAADIKIARA